jgi:transposase
MIFLSDDERAILRAQHKRERDKRICDRVKAVLLFDKKWSIASIAEVLLLSEDAIREHISEYRESKKLKPESGGSVEKLSAEQSKELEEHLQCHIYLYVKDIIAYVKSTWNITYSVPGMRNWLQRREFSYKKPAIVPGKANEEQQKKWLVEYGKLKQGLPKDETIGFMDGVHPINSPIKASA